MSNSSSNASTKNTREAELTRYLIRGWLPILVVLCIVLWLSGGFPPTAWKLLFSIIGNWGGLQATQGSTLIASFLIVLIQALLILVAWIILILVCIYEVRVIREVNDQERIARLQHALDTASVNSGSNSSTQHASVTPATPLPVPPVASAPDWPPMGANAVAVHPTTQPTGVVAPSAAFSFSDEDDYAEAVLMPYEDEQELQPTKSTGVRANVSNQSYQPHPSVPDLEQDDADNFPDNPFGDDSNPFGDDSKSNPFGDDEHRVAAPKNRGVRISSTHSNNPNGSGLDDVDPMAFVAPGDLDMDASDPFSVQSDVLDFFLDAKKPVAQQEPEEPEEEEPEEPLFVYGNPFEGELPEVFRYDMDLRRSVEDMQEETREREAAKGSASAKSGQDQADRDERSVKRGIEK